MGAGGDRKDAELPVWFLTPRKKERPGGLHRIVPTELSLASQPAEPATHRTAEPAEPTVHPSQPPSRASQANSPSEPATSRATSPAPHFQHQTHQPITENTNPARFARNGNTHWPFSRPPLRFWAADRVFAPKTAKDQSWGIYGGLARFWRVLAFLVGVGNK